MTEPVQSRFSQELQAYERKKSELVELCEGKFALFKGDEFGGVYDSPSAAYSAGIEKYGQDSFLIRTVLREERVEHIPALHLGLLHARL